MAGLTLWLVRHARVPHSDGLCYGRTDWPADVHATQAAALSLLAALPPHDLPVWSSPLERCQQLADGLMQASRTQHLNAQGLDPRLAEMDFGAWEGRPWADLTPADFAPWMADFGHHRVGGGESVNGVLARVAAALRDTVAFCERQGYAHALWVSHAGVARALQHLQQVGPAATCAADWPREAPAPGAWRCFSVPPASAAAPPG